MCAASLPSVHQADLAAVAAAFRLEADFQSGQPHGHGLINDTFLIHTNRAGQSVRFIFQRINHRIFRDVPALMDNVRRVTAHLDRRHRPHQRQTLRVMPTGEGAAYHRDLHGCYWRCYNFIAGAESYDVVSSPTQARAAAFSFGEFQRELADLPGPRLHETIPGFHDTPGRFAALQAAISADAASRVARAEPEIAFALQRETLAHVLLAPHRRGDIPERITHNDTKISNVMIDDVTGEGVCVIDLDTVMPGLALYDFGDLVRSATNPAREDERDLDRVRVQLPLFEQLVAGYLASVRPWLNAVEIEHLVVAGRLLAFEIGIRFLTDYLAGDVYYKTLRPEQNLDRARGQFTLLQSMETAADEMQRIVDRHL